MRAFSPKSWRYLLQGLSRRRTQAKQCPCCRSVKSVTVGRKFFHTLEECATCGIVFRFPSESQAEADVFYETEYAEPGLTTELPTSAELQTLISTKFKGSPKDLAKVIQLIQALGVKSGDRVLDYGANWGYGTWQLIEAGFDATGYELSRNRAQFGKRLGVEVITDSNLLGTGFKVVYSGHVLEHVTNPAEVLQRHLKLTSAGGYVVAHTPNGSCARREGHPKGFRYAWGRVHPVLLTERFIMWLFKLNPFYISSIDDPVHLTKWDGQSQYVGDLSGPGLFFVVRNCEVGSR